MKRILSYLTVCLLIAAAYIPVSYADPLAQTTYPDVPSLRSSTESSRGIGSLWAVSGEQGVLIYKEVASGGNTGWATSPGGVQWDVLPGADGWVEAIAFDLKGNGADDTAAIQAAFDAGFDQLRFPAGTFRHHPVLIGNVNVPQFSRIEGAGRNATIFKPFAGHNITAFELVRGRFSEIANFSIDMSATTGDATKALWVKDVQFANKIKNLKISRSPGYGIYVINPIGTNFGTAIEHCFVERCVKSGIYFQDLAGTIRACNVRRCGTPLEIHGGHTQVFGGIYEKSGNGPNIDIHGDSTHLFGIWTESQGSANNPSNIGSAGREHIRIRSGVNGTFISGLRTSEGRSNTDGACDVLIESGSKNTTIIGATHSGYNILAYKIEQGASGVHIINPSPRPNTNLFTLIDDASGAAKIDVGGKTNKSIYSADHQNNIGLSYVFSKRVRSSSSTAVLLEFSVPPSATHLMIEANIIGARAVNQSDAGTVRIAKEFFVVSRRSGDSDVQVLGNPDGRSWESAGLFQLGGSRIKNSLATQIVRLGAEAADEAQLIGIVVDAGTSGSGIGDVVADFRVTAIHGGPPVFE